MNKFVFFISLIGIHFQVFSQKNGKDSTLESQIYYNNYLSFPERSNYMIEYYSNGTPQLIWLSDSLKSIKRYIQNFYTGEPAKIESRYYGNYGKEQTNRTIDYVENLNCDDSIKVAEERTTYYPNQQIRSMEFYTKQHQARLFFNESGKNSYRELISGTDTLSGVFFNAYIDTNPTDNLRYRYLYYENSRVKFIIYSSDTVHISKIINCKTGKIIRRKQVYKDFETFLDFSNQRY